MYKKVAMPILMTIVSLFVGASTVFAASWTLEKDQNGIQAYSQYSNELGYNRVKLEMIVDAPVESLVAINTDAAQLNQWMDSFDDVEVVDQENWYDFLLYVTYRFPFPYQDRDSLSRTQVYRSDSGSIVIKFFREEEGKATSSDHIRMDYIDGAWELEEINEGQTKVVYTSLVSPGGDGPKWVINAFSLDVPFQSMINLKEVLKTYQPRQLSLDDLPLESNVSKEVMLSTQ